MTAKLPTMREFFEAKKVLKSRGWEELCSVMSGDKGDTRYGICFIKGMGTVDRREFWLNKDTINALPE